MNHPATFGLFLVLARSCSQAPTLESPVDYTEEELAVLADSEQVKRNLEPFAGGPAPDASQYVTMSDGVRIAVNLYFPAVLDVAASSGHARAPTVYSETWYSRGREADAAPVQRYLDAGFAVVIADPRGFGASFGSQSSYLSEEQREDQRTLFEWISEQSWSNGQVVPIGISVSAMLAEAALASGSPYVSAGIVRATEFDQYAENLFPGGVPNPRMHGLISYVLELMRGEPCLQDLSTCSMFGPVEEDKDATLLQAAMRDHQQNVTGGALEGVTYADDLIGGSDASAVSPKGHARQLADNAVPTRLAASWLDGMTAQGALARFNALPNVPMQVSLGATSHMGGLDADPFAREAFLPARTPPEAWFAADIDFAKRVLAGEPIERKIDYYVLGADTWKSTSQWPPRDVADVTLHLSAQTLERHAAPHAGERSYTVDPNTSSGKHNRWSSQDNGPIYFGDRRLLPGVRASFDAQPVLRDSELVGAPELCLVMSSDQSDGAVFAYLDDVAPDGRATYLSEGVLRLLHRKTKHAGCDAAPGTERSFERADAQPVVPFAQMEVEIPLLPVAARIEAGHHLRLSLAGADSDTFPMLSRAPATWSIVYGGEHGSTLRVPMRTWQE